MDRELEEWLEGDEWHSEMVDMSIWDDMELELPDLDDIDIDIWTCFGED